MLFVPHRISPSFSSSQARVRITGREKSWIRFVICGFDMDHKSVKDEDGEVDLESGLDVTEDYSKSVSSPGKTKQGKILFTKISYAGDCTKGEDRCSGCCKESKLTVVSMDSVKVTNKLYSVEYAENNTPEKKKHKKSSNKKAPKPPRPPRSPSLDAADQKLIREITELAMLKRARLERMKALKKMKAAKASSSSSSGMFAMVFTVFFCIVILLQGWSTKLWDNFAMNRKKGRRKIKMPSF